MGFDSVVRESPDRTALIDVDGRTRTFRQLAERVNQVSHALRRLGMSTGDVVAGAFVNRSAYYELRLAAQQIGLYFTPINYHLTASEIAYILADSHASVVVADAATAQVVDEALSLGDHRVGHRVSVAEPLPGWLDYEDVLADEPVEAPVDLIAGEFMGYTSGTTGYPKAVRKPLTDRLPGLSAFTVNHMRRLGIHAGDGVHLACGPLYHAGPGSFSIAALHLGHTVVIAERPRSEEILALIERHQITATFTVPTVLHRILRLPDEVLTSYDVSSMRALVHAGAPCPASVKRMAIEYFGPVVNEFYGTTEGSATAATASEWLTKPGTVGYPLPGIEVRVLGDEGESLPPGEVGDIYFTPPGPFEYWHDPDKTRAAMHDGFFSAGDMGYLDEDGWLFMSDRRSDMILSGGVNIYPAEIEAALISHPDVADVAVIGVPDEEWGGRVVAVVQPADAIQPGPGLTERLRVHCGEQIARYKMPRAFDYVEELPRNAAGKLQRAKVREVYVGRGEEQ